MGELDRFLASEAAQGLFLEQGEFSIATDKALQKLGRFALPDPGFWVLKLVQAAVSAGAAEINFTFERRKVEVRFPNEAAWEADQVLATLLSSVTPSSSPLRHLVAALLGAAMGFSQKITWSCGAHFVRVTKDGPTTEENTGQAELVVITATRPASPALRLGNITTPVRYLFRQTAHEYKALVDRCHLCPIPVVVDGYQLPRSYQVPIEDLPRVQRYDSDSPTGRGKLFAQFPLSGLGRPELPYPIDEQPLTTQEDLQEKLPSLRLDLVETAAEGVVCVYSCLQRQSRMNFVMDGILLHTELLSSYAEMERIPSVLENGDDDFVLDLHLPVPWSDLDLTGFNVRTGDLEIVAEVLGKSLSEVFDTIRSHCHLPWDLSTAPPRKKPPWNPSMADILGAAFMTMFIPQMLAVGTIVGGAYLVTKPVYHALMMTPLAERRKERLHGQEAKRLAARLTEIIDGLVEVPG